jgi:hypothetical protein
LWIIIYLYIYRGSWIYNCLCNQCLSPLMLSVRILIRASCTTLCDKVCQWLHLFSITLRPFNMFNFFLVVMSFLKFTQAFQDVQFFLGRNVISEIHSGLSTCSIFSWSQCHFWNSLGPFNMFNFFLVVMSINKSDQMLSYHDF